MSQTTLGNELERSVNAFDWTIEFPNVAAGRGFDVMVGNPPWLMAGYYVDESVPYMKENFATATGKFDLYYLFVEQCLRLVGDGGTVGLIIPNKFFHTRAALSLRQLLAGSKLSVVKDFGIEKVFEKATNYSCIIIIDNKDMAERVAYAQVTADMRARRRVRRATARTVVEALEFPRSGREADIFSDGGGRRSAGVVG